LAIFSSILEGHERERKQAKILQHAKNEGKKKGISTKIG